MLLIDLLDGFFGHGFEFLHGSVFISSDFFKEANDLVAHMERFADSVEDSYRLNVFHQDYEVSNEDRQALNTLWRRVILNRAKARGQYR